MSICFFLWDCTELKSNFESSVSTFCISSLTFSRFRWYSRYFKLSDMARWTTMTSELDFWIVFDRSVISASLSLSFCIFAFNDSDSVEHLRSWISLPESKYLQATKKSHQRGMQAEMSSSLKIPFQFSLNRF
jgi:hypothetical protein